MRRSSEMIAHVEFKSSESESDFKFFMQRKYHGFFDAIRRACLRYSGRKHGGTKKIVFQGYIETTTRVMPSEGKWLRIVVKTPKIIRKTVNKKMKF